MTTFKKDKQFYKFAFYGFLKNIRFTDPFILLFFIEEGLSFTSIGFLFAIRGVFVNVFEIPSGIFADGFGRRKAMLFCFFSYIVSFLLMYFFTGFPIFVAGMLFFAMGEAFRSGTHKSIILEHLYRKNLLSKKLEYYGHTRSWSQLGSACSALGAAALVFIAGSYRVIFISSVIPYVIGLFLIASYPSELDFPDSDKHKNAGWRKRYKESFYGLLSLFAAKKSRIIALNSGFYGGIFKSVKDYIQPILAQTAVAIPFLLCITTEQRTPLMVGLVYAGIYLLTSTASKRSSKFVRKGRDPVSSINILFFLSAVMIVLSGLFLRLLVPGAAVLCFVMLFVIQNLRRPMEVDYISNLIERNAMAAGLSVESQLKSLTTAAVAPLLGIAIDTFGISSALVFLGVITAGCGWILRLTLSEDRSAQDQHPKR